MKLETFFEKFDQFADAPDAIAKMRKLVLNLAVQGKLVRQDHSTNDYACADLESLFESRRTSSLKRTKIDAEATAKDPIIPESWISVSLGEVVSIRTGFAFKSGDYTDKGIFILRVTNINPDGSFDISNSVFLPDTKLDSKMKGFLLEENELLVVMVGGSLGKIGQVTSEILPALLNQNMWRLKPYSDRIDIRFLRFVLHDLNENRLQITSSTHGHLAMGTYAAAKIPFPCLTEQKRIVAKVDELMALCDQLEAQQQERDTQQAALARASLARFADAPTPANLNFLFHSSYHIQPSDLRKSILTLAVQGKLVPQNPDDEPAAEILVSGAKLPNGHVRRRKILKRIPIQAEPERLPILPPSWQYASVQTLYDLNIIVDYADGNHGSLYPRKTEFEDSGVTFVTAKDIAEGRVSWESCAKLNEERANQLTKGWAQGGDVLLTHNATVGRVARVEDNVARFLLGTSVTFYRLNRTYIDPGYLYSVFCSPIWQEQLEAIMEQTTRNQVSIQKQAFFQIPIPPPAEQRRIVAKVDQLIALVDELETQLTESRAIAKNLLEALVAELSATGASSTEVPA